MAFNVFWLIGDKFYLKLRFVVILSRSLVVVNYASSLFVTSSIYFG